MPPNDAQLRFTATLQDDASPQAEKLQQNLQKLGYNKHEISLYMRMKDEASQKLHQISDMVKKLPSEHTLNIRARADDAISKINSIKKHADTPIHLTFRDNLDQTKQKLEGMEMQASNVVANALPMGVGYNFYFGMLAGVLGGGGYGAQALGRQSVGAASDQQQQQQQLVNALRDNTAAHREFTGILGTASKTPFATGDMVSAQAALRQQGLTGNNLLTPVGNIAAGTGNNLASTAQAYAAAKQGDLSGFRSLGVPVGNDPFGRGGAYQGISPREATDMIARRYQGAQAAQANTFQGTMTELRNMFRNQVLAPIGQPIMGALQGVGQRLLQPQAQARIGTDVEKIQQGVEKTIDTVRRGASYFKQNLEEPLARVARQIEHIVSVFGHAFGSTLITTLQAVAHVLSSLSKPILDIVNQHQGLLQLYATFKALSILGITGPVKGLHDMAGALNPLHPSLFRLVGGFRELTSGLIKTGLVLLAKQFIDAGSATDRLHSSLQKIGQSNAFDKLNSDIAKMSGGLDISDTKLKSMTATAIQGLKPGTDASVGLHQAVMAQNLHNQFGVNANLVNRVMTQAGVGSNRDVDSAAVSIRALKGTTDQLNMSFARGIDVMNRFAGQAGPAGLGGIQGAPYLNAMSSVAHRPGFISESMRRRGVFSGDDLIRQMLTDSVHPSLQALHSIGTSPAALGGAFSLTNRRIGRAIAAGAPPNLPPGQQPNYTQTLQGNIQQIQDVATRYQKNYAADAQSRGLAQQLSGVSLPSAYGAPIKLPNMQALQQGGDPAKMASSLATAWQKGNDQLNALNKQINTYQQNISDLQNNIGSLTDAQSALNLKMEAFQHNVLLPLQRAIEDQQLTMQQYQFSALRPLEREMTRLSEASAVLQNKQENASYAMEKFSTGLTTGEQAALNQLHALERYSKQLDMLQLQYHQIGAELGTTMIDQGAKVRVNPLSNFTLAAEQERLQRRQQIAQDQYDLKYGEQHYKMQQAARSQFERQELPIGQRLKGIRDNRRTLDELQVSQHNMMNQQFQLQTRMYKVNEVIADQQDKLTKLQLRYTDRQLHGGLRAMEDAQFKLSQAIGYANIKLEQQQRILANKQQQVQDIKDIQGALSHLFDSLIDKPSNPLQASLQSIRTALAEHKITPARAQQMEASVRMADFQRRRAEQQGAPKTRQDWESVIKRAITGAFTGDLIQRLGAIVKGSGIPGSGLVGGIMQSGPVGFAATLATAVAAAFIGTGTLRNLSTLGLRQLGRGGARVLPERFGLRRGATFAADHFARDMTFGKAVTEPWHLSQRARVWGGRGVGAFLGSTVGGMFGGPLGGLLGMFGGAKAGGGIAERATIREWLSHPIDTFKKSVASYVKATKDNVKNAASEKISARQQSQAARQQHTSSKQQHNAAKQQHNAAKQQHNAAKQEHSAAKQQHNAAKQQHNNVKSFRARVKDFHNRIKDFRNRIKDFGHHAHKEFGGHVKSIGGHIKTFGSRVGRFGGIVSIFATFATLFNKQFGDAVSSFGKWVGQVFRDAVNLFKRVVEAMPGAHKIADAGRGGSRAARAVRDAARAGRGSAAARALGRVGRGAGRAARFLGKASTVGAWGLTGLDVARAIGGDQSAMSAVGSDLNWSIPGGGEWDWFTHSVLGKDESKGYYYGGQSGAAAAVQHAHDVSRGRADAATQGRMTSQYAPTSEAQRNQQFGMIQAPGESNSAYQTRMHHLHSHAGGIDRVTSSEKLVKVHQDEAVLHPGAADIWRRNKGKGSQGHQENFEQDVAFYFNKVLQAAHDHVLNLGSIATFISNPGQAKKGMALATGLDRVPHDEFQASLHKDEAVLNKHEAAKWRQESERGTKQTDEREVLDQIKQHRKVQKQAEDHHNKLQEMVSKHNRDLKKKRDDYNERETTDLRNHIKDVQKKMEDHQQKLTTDFDNFRTNYQHMYQDHEAWVSKLIKDRTDSQFKTYDTGWHHIDDTTHKWIGKIHDQVKGIDKTLGLTGGGGSTPAPKTPKKHEHGGLVQGGRIGTGSIIRVGEEGFDEVVIPLAPHRRDRAKSLIQQTKAQIHDFANGGFTSKANKEIQDKENLVRHSKKIPLDVIRKELQFFKDSPILPGFKGGGQASGGPDLFQLMVNAANQLDSHHYPYSWGGGHDAGFSPGGAQEHGGPGYDCSGAVSYVLHAAGLLGSPLVSGSLASWGDAGPGDVTIYANAGHTWMNIGGRAFGTHGSSGASWFDRPGGLPGFAVRHVPNVHGHLSAAQIAALGHGGGMPAIMLDDPPKELNKFGPMGKWMRKKLQQKKDQWQKKLDSMGGAGNIPGSVANGPAEKMIFDFFTKAGMNKIGIAGLIGNAVQESSLNWGAAGGGMWQQISNFGSGAPSPLIQMQKMLGQIQQSGVFARMNAAKTPEEAAIIFEQGFEKAGIPNNAHRTAAARAAFGAGYAGGIPRVPHDNFPAVLHEGERVLSSAEVSGGVTPIVPIVTAIREGFARHTTSTTHGRGIQPNTHPFHNEQKVREMFDSIAEINSNIKKAEKHLKSIKDKGEQKDERKHLDDLRDQLRAAWRTERTAQSRADHTIRRLIRGAGDESGGEATLAGVRHEQAHLHRTVAHYTTRAHHRLHHDRHHYRQLLRRFTGRHSAGGTRITGEERQILRGAHRRLVRDRDRYRDSKRAAREDYLVGAAERGINPRLLRSIMGQHHGLNKEQIHWYNRLEKLMEHNRHPGHRVHDAVKSLRTVLEGHKVQNHKHHEKHHKHEDHSKKHNDKTEQHHKETQTFHKAALDHLAVIAKKETSVNIHNTAQGAKLSSTVVKSKARRL